MLKNKVLTAFMLIGAVGLFGIKSASAQSDFELDLLSESKEKPAVTEKKKQKSSSTATKTFSETLESPDENKNQNNNESETWLKSLFSSGTEKILKATDPKEAAAEKKRLEQVLLRRRSNAANLDISGVKLRMTPKEIEEILTRQGYRKVLQTYEIPNFIKWRSEELCRQSGVIGFERLNACATRVSEENGYRFIEHETYNRSSSKETINVFYTSTFTDNLAHRIYYVSNIPMSFSKASKNVYINNLKVYDFWQRIDLRYGAPDNKSEVKWGLGGKKPYLRAETGKLELVDPMLKNMDMARMLNEDSRFANMPYYTF
ncbi:MAG: hypothetical protein J6C85_02560 [Alphaproteobacteria bacterium]|nr:hypothetical protein [Alphaproteobacteria bacterium]